MLKFSSDPNVAEQQMNAIIFYLTAFGYIDGDFDRSEKDFVRDYIERLVVARARDAMPDAEESVRNDIIKRFVGHFNEVFQETDHYVQTLFSEAVANEEKQEEFVYAKLKLRSYEIFRSFDEANQKVLLESIDELIHADGKVHPAEERFRDEIRALLATEIPLDVSDIEVVAADLQIKDPVALRPRQDNHPFFTGFEQHYSRDPAKLRKQAELDYRLMASTMNKLKEQREAGAGKLTGHGNIEEFQGGAPFLDGYVYVHPLVAGEETEVIVLGDLHGCYSCLKAALMQSDFFAKVEAHRLDPTNHPKTVLVLLGDYIDRGMFSYNGVLRTIMQLFLTAPENVFILRGNHEYYLEYQGRIYGGVRPAEAINTLVGHLPGEMFEAYMKLFDSLPSALLFGPTMFVHAGIPRDATIREKWTDLSSLNDPDVRFQMLWSDPSSADYVPDELQAQNARFPFGQIQFERFMAMIGCTTMVRGHERIDEGFRSVYDKGAARLLNLFSAGGSDNNDLPIESSYREVTPMAATIKFRGDSSVVTPWRIEYERFNDPTRNYFFATPPEIEHKAE